MKYNIIYTFVYNLKVIIIKKNILEMIINTSRCSFRFSNFNSSSAFSDASEAVLYLIT